MKVLLLCFTLFSLGCGKEHQPKALDYHDSDGDQLPNYQEAELDKYVANFVPLGEVKGVAKFFENGLKEIYFENSGATVDTKLLLTRAQRELPKMPYFSEWSQAQIRGPKPTVASEKRYLVSVSFQTGSDSPDELRLEGENRSLSLGRCEKSCQIDLKGQDLRDWIAGKLVLQFIKRFRHERYYPHDAQETIQEQTYRLRIGTAQKVETFYVSKKLKLEDLLTRKGIIGCVDLDATDLFSTPHSEKQDCFIRKLGKDDYVVAEGTLSELKKSFLALNFSSRQMEMTRVNGITITSPMKLKNAPGARVYIKVSGITRTVRTFREKKESRTYSFGGGALNGNGPDQYSCNHHLRLIAASAREELDVRAFLDNIIWIKNGRVLRGMPVDIFSLDETIDGKRVVWGLKIDATETDIEFTLPPRQASSYVTTGEFASECEKGYPARSLQNSFATNEEEKLTFSVESFVENL